MNNKEILQRIRRLDYEVVRMLNQRMELSLRASRLNSGLNSEDDNELIKSMAALPERLVSKNYVEDLFKGITGESARLQQMKPQLVGIQGEHGANSDAAVRSGFPNMVPIPCMKFIDVFDGVKNGWLDYGLVPVENSNEGGVVEVNDLLIKENLFIGGEVRLRVRHSFLTLKETDPDGIRVVYSHPQALAQCRGFINNRRLEDRPFYNTAGAAKMLSETRPKASAVIASQLCADIYGLKLLETNIEDNSANYTRFVLITREKPDGTGNKCSYVFSTHHECGALNEVLAVFAESGINLTRIESRPAKNQPGNFVFLVDFKGSLNDPHIAEAIEKVSGKTTMLKLLGCYNEAGKSL